MQADTAGSARALPLVALATLIYLGACSSAPDKQADGGTMAPQATGKTLVYECPGYEFVARTGPGEIAVYMEDDYRVLGQVRSASGARYTDTEVTLWTKGELAILEIGAKRYSECVLNRSRAPWEEARRRGVDFRAVGQEPGWQLEIQHDRNMLFVAGYGAERVLLPTPDAELVDGGERYQARAGGRELLVEIELRHCIDSMSGEAFTNEVRVTLDGSLYRGCGTSLEAWWD